MLCWAWDRHAARLAAEDGRPRDHIPSVRWTLVVDLNLVQIVVGGLVDMLTSDESQALTALIEYVAGTRGVLAFIKKMRGRTPEVVEQVDGQVRVVTQKGEIVEVPARDFRQYESIMVRHQAREVLKPLGKEGVEQIELQSMSGAHSASLPNSVTSWSKTSCPTRIDLRADDDRRVDLHPLTFDVDGDGLQQLHDGSFDADGLRGVGPRRGATGRVPDACTADTVPPRVRAGRH